MLDKDTKKRIDDLRQTLVGKVPDPKAQVEQITFALIYKFMDDMDNESLKMGGVPSYFIGEYEKYSWKNLFNTKLGGQDLVLLYNESITQMNNNPNLPSVFRDIFKNAGINYRDPETLRLFLKKINEFEYTNSEKLGDAYEYLLSVLGSQGNAGQFRTPRNIIEFIVKILKPQKNETILDPACGTSGFLISSYKHILETNKNNLKPDERNQIIENIYGYDLDPEMVRMSIVNMYLHNFTDPKISEYDTLTSEEKWNDYFDVILANPPFMSPKGGIRPHKRFSINSSRSEVLFIDYIIEHLTPNGRSGIIVPAGIIFDDDNSYVNIRKRLVKDALVGIVSLPKGVFLPYSAVKTSILILDKKLSKEKDDIFFINIDNDGFSLNNSRKPIKKNDLPSALEKLEKNECPKLFKKDILDNEKISFVYTDYIKEKKSQNLKFNNEKMSNVLEVFTGSRQKGGSVEEGIPSIGGAQIDKFGNILHDKMVYVSKQHYEKMKKGKLKKGDVLIVKDGATTGKMCLYNGEYSKAAINEHIYALRTKENYNNHFLYYLLKNDIFQKKLQPFIQGIIGGINLKFLNIEIPCPSKEDQTKIVNELDSYQKIINACREILTNYKPSFSVRANWKEKKIKEISKLSYGIGEAAQENGNYRIVRITDIDKSGLLKETEKKYINIKKTDEKYILKKGEVLIARTGATFGKCLFFESDEPSVYAGYLIKLEFNEEIIPKFFWIFSQSENFNLQKQRLVVGGAQPQFNANVLGEVLVPIPPIEEQKSIVNYVLEEQKIINENSKLIKKFETKMNERINSIWNN